MMLRGTTSVTSVSEFLSWFSLRLTLNMYSLTASDPGFRPRHTTYLGVTMSRKGFTEACIFCLNSNHEEEAVFLHRGEIHMLTHLSELAGLLVTGLKRQILSKQR